MIPMKLGIALSGGGAKGSIHLGILHALEDQGIKADMYAGTSAGAVVASAKAFGMSNKSALDTLSSLDISILDFDYLGIIGGLFNRFSNLDSLMKGKKLNEFLIKHFDLDMKDVKYPLGIVSTDLDSGAQIIFSSQEIKVAAPLEDVIKVYTNPDLKMHEIVYASSAIPGVFPPRRWKSHNLSDGSLVNNLPVNVLKAMGADKVLAINIGSPEGNARIKGLMNILNKSIDILIDQNVDYSLVYSNDHMLLYPEISGIGAFDFNKGTEGYLRGYNYGVKVADQVKKFLNGAE